MDDEGGQVERPGALDHLALVIDQQEVLDADLPEAHAERVHPEVVGELGVARGDVAGRALAEAEPAEQAEGGGEPLLAVAAFLRHARRTGERRGARDRTARPSVRPLYRSVHRMGRVDFTLSEPERALVGLCRDFARNEIAPRAPAAWEEARCPTDLLREMGALGLLGMLIPEEWGGIGMSTVGFVAAMEQIGLADQSVAAAWQAHVTIGSLPLYLFGDDAQRERWLRPLAEGTGPRRLRPDRARRRLRRPRHQTRAERQRRWVGDQRAQDLHLQRRNRHVLRRDPAGTDRRRSERGAALRQLRRGEGRAGLHHGAEDARDRLAGARYP